MYVLYLAVSKNSFDYISMYVYEIVIIPTYVHMIIYIFSLFYLFQTVWCLTIYLAFGLGSARHHHYRRGGETIQNANEHGKYYINVAIS
jgi:hypothetical protein